MIRRRTNVAVTNEISCLSAMDENVDEQTSACIHVPEHQHRNLDNYWTQVVESKRHEACLWKIRFSAVQSLLIQLLHFGQSAVHRWAIDLAAVFLRRLTTEWREQVIHHGSQLPSQEIGPYHCLFPTEWPRHWRNPCTAFEMYPEQTIPIRQFHHRHKLKERDTMNWTNQIIWID